jgi:hypothetical protein
MKARDLILIKAMILLVYFIKNVKIIKKFFIMNLNSGSVQGD